MVNRAGRVMILGAASQRQPRQQFGAPCKAGIRPVLLQPGVLQMGSGMEGTGR